MNQIRTLLIICCLGLFLHSITAQNFADLVVGVDTAWTSGSPGPLLPLGSNAVPIVAGDPLTASLPSTFCVASTVGAGRSFALGHDGLIHDNGMGHFDNLTMATNVVDWLDQGNTMNMIMTRGHAEWVRNTNATILVNHLTGMGYNVNSLFGTIEASDLTGVGVVMIGNAWGSFTAAELTVLEDYVQNGGGLLLMGLGWSWGANNLDNYPMNHVGEICNVRWIDGSISDPTHNFNGTPLFLSFYPDIVAGSFDGACALIDSVTAAHPTNLPMELQNDPVLRSDYFNAHFYLKEVVLALPETHDLRDSVYQCYIDLVNAHPAYFQKGQVYDKFTENNMGWLRERVHRTLRDALPITPARKNEIATTLNYTGRYLDVWNEFLIVLADNSSLDPNQKEYIYQMLASIPPELHNLRRVSFKDEIGAEPFGGFLNGIGGDVNTFSTTIGNAFENSFPPDVPPGFIGPFCAAAPHEANHVVDAFYVAGNLTFNARKNTLLAQAGLDDLNYLRSQVGGAFFQNAPQEFIASISNQWFTDTKKTLDLGIIRMDGGRAEPLNQFLYFVDLYSVGTDSTRFYNGDVDCNFSWEYIPISRDANGFVNSVCLGDSLYTFNIDAMGNVTSYVPLTQMLSGNIPTNDYQAGYQIHADGTVQNGSDVTMNANHSVELQANFEVVQGGVLTVTVTACQSP